MITSFASPTVCYPTKININEIDKTQLSSSIKSAIMLEFQKDKLMYELYIESATSPNDFRSSLINRGFKNIPLQQINLRINESPKVNEDVLITKKSTMIRRYSDQSRRT